MKKLKFTIVVMMSLSVSLEAFAFTAEESVPPVRESVEMSGVELEVQIDPSEGVFEEDLGVDITSKDLENTLQDAFASR